MKKIKGVLLLFATIVSFENLQAQTWAWAQGVVGPGVGDGFSVASDAAGNVFVAGVYNNTIIAGNYTLIGSPGLVPFDACLIKYNSAGTALWAKSSITAAGGLTFAWSVCTDGGGNSYMVGSYGPGTSSFGNYTLAPSSGGNMFIVKYDANGNVMWAKNSIDNGADVAYGVACDPSGNIYVTGQYNGTQISFGSTTLTGTGNQNAFLVKYNSAGNVLWARNSVSSAADIGQAVCTDTNGNVYITGAYTGPLTSFGTATLNNAGTQNIFLTKYDQNGNVLWARSGGGSGNDQGYSVTADALGNTYITGVYASASATFGNFSINNAAITNMFLAKYDAAGNALWAKTSVTTNSAMGYCAAATGTGGVFVSGAISPSSTATVFDTFTLTPAGLDPAFLVRYDAAGNCVFANGFISGGDDNIAICTDRFCNAYLAGDYEDNPFVLGNDTLPSAPMGLEYIFTAKLSYSNTNCVPAIDGVVDEDAVSRDDVLFPNPNRGSFSYLITDEMEDVFISVANYLGEIVYVQRLERGVNRINLPPVKAGLYFYSVKEKNVCLKAGKVLIE